MRLQQQAAFWENDVIKNVNVFAVLLSYASERRMNENFTFVNIFSFLLILFLDVDDVERELRNFSHLSRFLT